MSAVTNIRDLIDRICEDEDICPPDCWCCAQEQASSDEVLTNSDSARWIRLCVDFESREDFNEPPAGAPLTHIAPADGMGAPLAFGGAASGGER